MTLTANFLLEVLFCLIFSFLASRGLWFTASLILLGALWNCRYIQFSIDRAWENYERERVIRAVASNLDKLAEAAATAATEGMKES